MSLIRLYLLLVLLKDGSLFLYIRLDPNRLFQAMKDKDKEPPKISLIIQSSNVIQSSSMILVCSSNTYPTPNIRWQVNKTPIAEYKTPIKDRQTLPRVFSLNEYQSSSLVITKLLMSDSNSVLTCEADNNSGMDSRHQKLTVISKDADLPQGFPSFQNNFFPLVKPVNCNVTIVCLAQGNPLPMIQWFKNYELVLDGVSKAKIFNDGSLFLSHISREDRGIYHCQAQNTVGLRLSDPSVLEIADYPVTPKSVSVVGFGSEHVDISWKSGVTEDNDYENFTVYYEEVLEEKNNSKVIIKSEEVTPIAKNSFFKYTLKNLFPYTTYKVWLKSHNELGVSPPTANISFKTLSTPPRLVPRSITATSISNTAILVSWKPPRRQFGKFKTYQVIYSNNEAYLPQHWRNVDAKDTSVMLTHLTPLELYHIRVKVVNEIGHGPLSNAISIITRAGTLSQCPDFKITELFLSHMKLEWGTPDPTRIFREILFNLQCWNVLTKPSNTTATVTTQISILNTNLSIDKMYYILSIKDEKHIKCKLHAMNEEGIGMSTEIQTSTTNIESSIQNLFYIVKIGSSFIYFKWKTASKLAFDNFLWVYRIKTFDQKEKYSNIPKDKLNLSNSMSAENEWFIYNLTKIFSSSQYVLGLRYLMKDLDGVLREYVHRSDVIETLRSDPSLVSNLQVFRGCMNTISCIEVRWNNNQQFGSSDVTEYKLKYRIISPKALKTNYSIHTMMYSVFNLETHNKPNMGVTYEFLVSKYYKNKYGNFSRITIHLPEGAPSDSPKDLQISEINSDSVRVSWNPPDPIYRNGEIILYQLRYFAVDQEETTEKFLNFTETSGIITKLVHYQYRLFVRAFTKVGPGIWSNSLSFYRSIIQELPVPINLQIHRISETEIKLSWTLPLLTEKNRASPTVTGFVVYYSTVNDNSKWIHHPIQNLEFSTKLKELKINMRYKMKVASVTLEGAHGNFSEVVEEVVESTIPQLKLKTVRNLRCSVQSSKMLKVEWHSPSMTTDILKFEIIYSGNLNYTSTMGLEKYEYIDKKTASVAFETNVKVHSIKLNDLQSNAAYKIAIRPIYFNEDSYQSHLETTCITDSSVPDSVEAPIISGLNKEKNQVTIKLFRCSEKNGRISSYYIIVGAFQLSDNSKVSLLKDPGSYTFMELSINTKSIRTEGVYIAISKNVNEIFTTKGINFSDIYLGDETKNALSINKKLKRDYYYKCFVRVCLGAPNNSMCKSSPWSNAFMINNMIAEINSSSTTQSKRRLQTVVETAPVSNSVLIMVSLVSGVFIATAIIIVGCVIKRKKSKERFMNLENHDGRSSLMIKSSILNGVGSADKILLTPELEVISKNPKRYSIIKLKPNVKSAPDLVTADSVLMCQDGTKLSPVVVNESKKMRITSQKLDNAKDRPPIPICNLYQYVSDLKANDCALLQSEFETLNTNLDDRFSWQRSNIDSNKSKNRYANVVAYDHTSVLLTPLDDVIGSDYINANYIDGYQKQNVYIATQGPLPDTTDDFWRMVWEQRSSCIVMMTRLQERSGVKCHQYWPNRGFICYGQMIVSHVDTFFLSYYTIRIFEVRHSKYSETREVQHFQFTAWPDHGVPKLSTPLLMFIRKVRSIGKTEAGPKIVHCSAGVGRTGAFIVVDTQLERIKQEKTIDVFSYVSRIRCQRNYMVQTQAQYQFILETLLEAVEDGNTEVMACNFHAHVTKLSQIGISGTNQLSGFEMEFSKLNSLASNRGRHGVMLADFVKAAGNQTVNLTKNRVRNIIPYDWNRVVLTAIRGIEGSDYINASYIDGYRERRAYIACQSPIPSTVEDFWRMIWDQHCGVVIVLNQPHEDKSHIYWPVNKSIRYQFFVVDPVVEYNMPNYILREFKVTDARDGEFRALRQFQFTQWPSHGCPKESESILDFIRQVHKTKEQFGHMEPMVIHCSTGSGRTGVFITLSIVLDRLQQESVVDMYQTVKLLHKQRIGLVQTEEQYEFCYMAVLDYLSNYEKTVEKSDLY